LEDRQTDRQKTQTDRETDRQKHRQIERQTDRQTDRQHRQVDRHTDGPMKLSNSCLHFQINSQSLLGATHIEARQAFHEVIDRLSLLVCKGYDPSLAELHELDCQNFDTNVLVSDAMLRYEGPKTS
jgi:hypothetical protein